MEHAVQRIVVTGAAGFLGGRLLERLASDKRYSVIALSSRPEKVLEGIPSGGCLAFGKDSIYGDSAEAMLSDAIVYNCAYPRASTGVAIADGLGYIQGVFEAAAACGARAIVNISSQSVYSPRRTEAATEQTPVSLESPYAVGKYATELMLGTACRHSGTAYTSIRMASLIGPGFDQRIVNRFVKQALETGRLSVKRDNQRFGFFDVEDAVDGLVKMIDSDASAWKPAYNLGGRDGYSLVEIAQTVGAVLRETDGIDVRIRLEDSEASGSSLLDASLFEGDFGPLTHLELAESVRRIREKLALER